MSPVSAKHAGKRGKRPRAHHARHGGGSVGEPGKRTRTQGHINQGHTNQAAPATGKDQDNQKGTSDSGGGIPDGWIPDWTGVGAPAPATDAPDVDADPDFMHWQHGKQGTTGPQPNPVYFCESEEAVGNPNCQLLDQEHRQEFVRQLGNRLDKALDSLDDAISKARLDLVTQRKDNVSWFVAALFGLGVGGLLGEVVDLAVSLAASAVAKYASHAMGEAVEAHADIIGGVLEGGAEPTKDAAKDAMEGGDNDAPGKQGLLNAIHDRAMQLTQQIDQQAPQLDDVDLLALYDAYDEKYHHTERYQRFIADKLRRYDENMIDEVGTVGYTDERDDDGHKKETEGLLQAVKIGCNGHVRTALVRQLVAAQYLHYTKYGYLADQDQGLERIGPPKFLRFVDADFVALASERSAAGSRQLSKGFKESQITQDSPEPYVYQVGEIDPNGSYELSIWEAACKANNPQMAPLDDAQEGLQPGQSVADYMRTEDK